jgi:hypothetical protein
MWLQSGRLARTPCICAAWSWATDIHNLCIGVVELVRPVRAEFQWQHKLIRSTLEAAQAYTAYAMGRGRESLYEAVAAFFSGPVLEQAGAHFPGNWPPGLAGLDHEDPLVLADNLQASRLATFLLELIKNRLRSTSWSELGYPGRFAACLHSDAQAAKVLEAMKEDWANWQHVQGLTRGPWKQNKKRSPFHLVVVQKAMLLNTRSFQNVFGTVGLHWVPEYVAIASGRVGLHHLLDVLCLPFEMLLFPWALNCQHSWPDVADLGFPYTL